MTRDEFWEHIRATRRRDPDEHSERLAARLGKLPLKEILAFGRWWHVMEVRSYTAKLWGAAYLINGGCSDDGFDYFRWWLILRGREMFEAALKKPDSLADMLQEDGEVEALMHPVQDAYCAVTNGENYFQALAARYPKLPTYPDLKETWDFDNDSQMRKRYPKLFAAYDEVETG